ncbi:hypothetical protein [Thiobaca trueperi]|uniref:hypothetical protein n=1 Tax=Thiobaca trueperi TaxID=127458 RepID=UPI0010534471|nr:hypothetical protein [Thiobaca trueperi]
MDWQQVPVSEPQRRKGLKEKTELCVLRAFAVQALFEYQDDGSNESSSAPARLGLIFADYS